MKKFTQFPALTVTVCLALVLEYLTTPAPVVILSNTKAQLLLSYTTPATLIADFWRDVDLLKEPK